MNISSGQAKGLLVDDRRLKTDDCYSPIHAPYGFNDSMWSKTIFIAAVMGTASTRPIAPHSHPQTSSAMVTARGFNCSRLPRNLGRAR